MDSKKDTRYAVDKQVWLDSCDFPNCEEKEINCPKCDKLGHRTYWLNITRKKGSMFGVDILIKHAHHVLDKDVGRHVTHKIGETYIDEEHLEKKYVLNEKKLPRHVLKELESYAG